MKFVLIRHGEIDSNRAKIYSGRSDEPLNATGRSQAIAAADRLIPLGLKHLYTSPLRRARETAAILGERVDCEPVVIEAFNELLMGPWEGLSEAEVEVHFRESFALWNRAPADLVIVGRETLQQVQVRAVAGVLDVARRGTGGVFGVVSHVAVIRTVLLFTERRPLNDYKRIHVPNASPVTIEWNEEHLTEAERICGH